MTATVVDHARRSSRSPLRSSALYGDASLNGLLAEVFVKHENHQPVGAFKVRGRVNLISQLSPEERERGVIAASTGNHGQSIAYAAHLFGVRATICVPVDANPGEGRLDSRPRGRARPPWQRFRRGSRHAEELALNPSVRVIGVQSEEVQGSAYSASPWSRAAAM